jgi:hypothetical protein
VWFVVPRFVLLLFVVVHHSLPCHVTIYCGLLPCAITACYGLFPSPCAIVVQFDVSPLPCVVALSTHLTFPCVVCYGLSLLASLYYLLK